MDAIRPRDARMEIPNYGFPMSSCMTGFPIPGVYVPVATPRVCTYPDGTDHELAQKRRRKAVNPIVSYPHMGEEHGKNHLFAALLKSLSHGKTPEQDAEIMSHVRRMQGAPARRGEGYAPMPENRMWRET